MGEHDHRDDEDAAKALPNLSPKNSMSISQEAVPFTKENRLTRKRQLSTSVSKLIILIIRVLTSENRKPNFPLLHVLGLVSPQPGQKQ